jgi:hypothetical protein
MFGFAHGGLELEEGHEAFEGDAELGEIDADAVELFEGRVEGHERGDENR